MNVRNLIGKHAELQPSELEKLKFAEYVRAVTSPEVILDDLEQGRVSDEVLETWETLYPEELQELRTMIGAEVESQARGGREFDELEIRTLNKLMGAGDNGYTTAMQRAYEQPEQQQPAGGAPNLSAQMPTRLDRALNRDIGG